MAQALKVRLPDGRVVAPSEWTSTPLYTTVEVNTGALTPLPGFSYGIGGPVPGSPGPRISTIADTNFEGAGNVLAENEELLLFSIQIDVMQVVTAAQLTEYFTGNLSFTPDPPLVTATNLLLLQEASLVTLRIAETKEYCRAPLAFFGAGMGIHSVLGAARTRTPAETWNSTMFHALNGGTQQGDNREFATPHHIAPGEAFEITLDFPYGSVREPVSGAVLNFGTDATSARLRARIFAVGVRRRPVA